MTYFKLALVTLGALFIGCGGSDSNSVDGNTGSGGSGDLCASLPQNTAPSINDSVDSSAWPGGASLGSGGTIESGKFYETQHVYYSPSSTPNHMWTGTMVIDGSAKTILNVNARDGQTLQQFGATYTTNGNQLSFTVVCPTAAPTATFYYTYANGMLTFFTDSDKTATVFQKQ